MKKPGDETPDPPGGRAAERLREFLEKRLPPGATPDDLNPEIADGDADVGDTSDDAPRSPAQSPTSKKPFTGARAPRRKPSSR
jgi:hypothetical protein